MKRPRQAQVGLLRRVAPHFGFCVQLVVNRLINLMLTLISFFGSVNETDG